MECSCRMIFYASGGGGLQHGDCHSVSQAELEKVQTERDAALDRARTYAYQIATLTAENKRLREALEKVRDEYAISHHDPSASLDLINDYATEALSEKGKEE